MQGQAFYLHPGVRYLLGPGLMAVGGLFPHPAIAIPGVVFGWLLIAASSRAADLALGVEDAQRSLKMLLDNAVTCFEVQGGPSPTDRSLRANIMVFDPEEDGLRIAYATAGYSSGETTLLWRKSQGCVGRAWEQGGVVVAPEDVELPVQASDADLTTRPWNMTVEQIRMTADRVASVISVPLTDDRGEFLGVFSVDDEKPLSESVLGSPDVKPAVEQLAHSLVGLLIKAGPEGPTVRREVS